MSSQRIDFGRLQDRLQQIEQREERLQAVMIKLKWLFAGAMLTLPLQLLAEPISLADGGIRYGPVVIIQDAGPVVYVFGILMVSLPLFTISLFGYRKVINYDSNPTEILRVEGNYERAFEDLCDILESKCDRRDFECLHSKEGFILEDPNRPSGGILLPNDELILRADLDDKVGIVNLTFNQRDPRSRALLREVMDEFD